LDDPSIVVIVSDLHLNSTVALCPDVVQRDEGGTYFPSADQRKINKAWKEFWQTVKARTRKRLVVVINGDIFETQHHGTTEVITPNKVEQFWMGQAILDPVAQEADELFIVRGTRVHSGPAGEWEEVLAKDLGAVPNNKTGAYSWWKLPLRVDGVLFDIKHHPQTSGRLPWTIDPGVSRQGLLTRTVYLNAGLVPPDIVVRSHKHTFGRGYARDTFSVSLPGWQLETEWVHAKLDIDGRIGGVIFSCLNAKWSMEEKLYGPFTQEAVVL